MVRQGDGAVLARLWKLFPTLTEDDQRVLAMAINHSSDINHVRAIVDATRSAKSEVVVVELLDAASRLTFHALADPAKAGLAERVADDLKNRGIARDFLIERMNKTK